MRVARAIGGGAFPVQVYDGAAPAVAARRILVLKLDHLGDFVIGAPSLRRLREAFPRAHVRLVVGSWNRAAAEALGVADEVRVLDVLSLHGGLRRAHPAEEAAALEGAFDIAVDLRVDDDTRPLLAAVDARLRCGLGPPEGSPLLDVALPAPSRWEDGWSPAPREVARFGPDRFVSRLPVRRPLRHEGPLAPMEGHAIHGPGVRLPPGDLEVRFDLAAHAPLGRLLGPTVSLDVARDGEETGAARRLAAGALPRAGGRDGVALRFRNDAPGARWEFRVHLGGARAPGRLLFGGASVLRADGEPPPRMRPSPLHVGERLGLLVELVRERVAAPDAAGAPAAAPRPGEIVVAPFSNSDLRDWPAPAYAELIGRLARDAGRRVVLVGTAGQRDALERLRRACGAEDAVANLGGATPWADLPGRLRAADLVICNNSGVGHAAAAAGARVLALYSASHTPTEWGPRGPRAQALMAATPCSPCGFDQRSQCPFDMRCMRALTVELVLSEALRRLAEP